MCCENQSWLKCIAVERPSALKRCRSSEPALAATVMLHVAEALASGARQAEVELLHVLVSGQLSRRAIHHHAAVFENVTVVREAKRDIGVLFRKQEADVLVLVQVADNLEDLLDDLRGKPHRRFVEEDHRWLR